MAAFSPSQESLQLHRPDFISRSGERIKRLKLVVQERKLQNMLQSEREALFNTEREWQGYRDLLSKRGTLVSFLLRGREGKVCFLVGAVLNAGPVTWTESDFWLAEIHISLASRTCPV